MGSPRRLIKGSYPRLVVGGGSPRLLEGQVSGGWGVSTHAGEVDGEVD